MIEYKIKWIKKILEGWKKGELSDFQAMYLIYNEVYPATITQKDIKWAKRSMEKQEIQ